MSLYELVFIARQEVSPVRAKELAKKVNDFIKALWNTYLPDSGNILGIHNCASYN